MVKYCELCRSFHEINDICPKYKQDLKAHPEWMTEAANFATVAAEYALVSTNALDSVARGINNAVGTNFAYEGTHQVARDIQVFAKLNSDSFRNSGQFANAEAAKQTLDNASDGLKRYLKARLNGTGEEIDWLRWKQGKLSSLFEKSSLPDGNTVGYDGETVNRFTGKLIEKTTIKASESNAGLGTNVSDVLEALKKGTLDPNDFLTGVKGTKEALNKALDKNIEKALASGDKDYAAKLRAAKDNMKINELGTQSSTKDSTERLLKKISNGQANTQLTAQQVASKMAQGAVIGAAVGLTISSITNFIKYKRGEITEAEAFCEVGEDSIRGLLTGGAMSGITLFLPGGPLGFVAGMAIGIYINAVCTNMLDEVFGKGAYEQILNAAGYVTGTAKNINEMLGEYGKSVLSISKSNADSRHTLNRIRQKEEANKQKLSVLNGILEDF